MEILGNNYDDDDHYDTLLVCLCKLIAWRSNHSLGRIIRANNLFKCLCKSLASCWALSTCHSFQIIAVACYFRELYFILHLRFCLTTHSRFSFEFEFEPKFEPIKRHTQSNSSTWRVVSCYANSSATLH